MIEENVVLTGMFEMVSCPKGQPAFSLSSRSALHFRDDDLTSPNMSRDYSELDSTGSRVGLALRFEKERGLILARCVTFVQVSMLTKIESRMGMKPEDLVQASGW